MQPKRQEEDDDTGLAPAIECISAVSLATHDMARAVRFYRALGFSFRYGAEDACFTSFHAGTSYLNLITQPVEQQWSCWGRVIFYVPDVDAFYTRALAAGLRPDGLPSLGRAVFPSHRPGRP